MNRFQVVDRLRYGVTRTCILDSTTGLIAVFMVNFLDVRQRCADLNAQRTHAGNYVWVTDAEPERPSVLKSVGSPQEPS